VDNRQTFIGGTNSAEAQLSLFDAFGNSSSSELLSGQWTSNQDVVNRDLVLWIARDLQPLSTISDPGFRYFVQQHVPWINVLDDSTLRRKYVGEVYEMISAAVRAELETVSAVNLMFDGWTDRRSAAHYLALRVQYVTDDWTGRVATLSVKRCGQDSNSITAHVKQELEEFIPNYDVKTLCATHDGSSTMISVSRNLKANGWQNCVARALDHLVMTDGILQVATVAWLVRKCKDIITTLHLKCDLLEREVKDTKNEMAARALLRKIAEVQQVEECGISEDDVEELDKDDTGVPSVVSSKYEQDSRGQRVSLKRKKPRQGIPTCWNSCLAMMKTLVQMNNEVDVCLRLIGQYDKCLTCTELSVVEELTFFLSHFHDFADLISTSVTSLSLIEIIRKETADICVVDPLDSSELAALKQAVQCNLDTRLPLDDSVVLATLLDPSTKNLLNMEQGEKMDVLLTAVKAEVPPPAVSSSSVADGVDDSRDDKDSKPMSKRRRLLQKHRVDVPFDDVIRAEITSYLQAQADDESEEDPLLFWKLHPQFENLKHVAKTVLTRSASCVAVECMFSTTGLILNGKRCRLSADDVNAISFIHDNFAFLGLGLNEHAESE